MYRKNAYHIFALDFKKNKFMSELVSIRKGLDIKIEGEADKVIKEAPKSKVVGLNMSDFHGITPKLAVKQGDIIKAGDPLFYAKHDSRIQFVSPVSGEVTDIVRGEKRRILNIVLLADDQTEYRLNEIIDIKNSKEEDLKNYLLATGAWAFIKQRPYDIVANPNQLPRDIFISAYDSAPLAPDYDYTLKGKEEEIQAAVDALNKLTSGRVYIGLSENSTVSPFNSIKNIEKISLKGPHPIGNVGTQINKVSPINKGEVVWTVNPADLVVIGELLLKGTFNMERVVATTGYNLKNPHYLKTIAGSQLSTLLIDNVEGDNNRYINGNVLTGYKSADTGFLGYYTTQVTVIEEGNDYDFFGWNRPRPEKFSFYRAFMTSWLTPNKKYRLNTNTNGEHRAFVLTGKFEKVFPMDIYPLQLLKACITKDIDKMEQLGIYEVSPEDFALTEFIDTSKNDHQEIIREGLDLMIKEVG